MAWNIENSWRHMVQSRFFVQVLTAGPLDISTSSLWNMLGRSGVDSISCGRVGWYYWYLDWISKHRSRDRSSRFSTSSLQSSQLSTKLYAGTKKFCMHSMLHADVVNIQVHCDFAIWAPHDLQPTFCDTPQHQQAIQLVSSALNCRWRGTTEHAEGSTELSIF